MCLCVSWLWSGLEHFQPQCLSSDARYISGVNYTIRRTRRRHIAMHKLVGCRHHEAQCHTFSQGDIRHIDHAIAIQVTVYFIRQLLDGMTREIVTAGLLDAITQCRGGDLAAAVIGEVFDQGGGRAAVAAANGIDLTGWVAHQGEGFSRGGGL
jgi:hypothetical protein